MCFSLLVNTNWLKISDFKMYFKLLIWHYKVHFLHLSIQIHVPESISLFLNKSTEVEFITSVNQSLLFYL